MAYYGGGDVGGTNANVVTPGAITYTTTTTKDGHIVYHPFKAVAASYNTPKGIVSGIQWVPAEATSILPPGARPADEDFAASWNRGQLSEKERQDLREWQRGEEKRRRQEEKTAAKKLREQDRSSPSNSRTGGMLSGILGGNSRTDPDLQRARERDNSTVVPGSLAFPTSGHNPYLSHTPNAGTGSGYVPFERERKNSNNTSPYPQFQRDRKPSNNMYGAVSDITRGVAEMDASGHAIGSTGLVRPRKYSSNSVGGDFDRSRRTSNNMGAPAGYIPPGYGGGRAPSGQMAATNSPFSASPNMRGSEVPFVPQGYGSNSYAAPSPAGTSSNVYPPGHIMAGDPVPGSMPGAYSSAHPSSNIPVPFPSSRNPSPRVPSGTREDQQLLAAPPGFLRTINAAQAYTPFEPIKISEMNTLLEALPPLPLILANSHDVYLEDWIRFTQDLSLAWSDRLPVPELPRGGRPSIRTLSADLIELWNTSFFLARGVEAILFKGRERRSGPRQGEIDMRLPTFVDNDAESSSSSSSSSSSDSDSDSDNRSPRQPTYDVYGRQSMGQVPHDVHAASQRRREKRAEKKRRRKEKKMRRKAARAKAKANQYALYITYVPPERSGAAGGNSHSMPAQREPAYPAQREPAYPAQREPAYPAQREPAYPAQREPAYPAQRESTYPGYAGSGGHY